MGDSNPRYGYPHGSLANCWFQPLTQPSSRKSLPNQQASFSNAVAKVLLFSGSTKFFSDYFLIKMHFFCNPLIFRTPFLGFFSSKMPFHGKMPIKVKKRRVGCKCKTCVKSVCWDYKHILFYEKIKKADFQPGKSAFLKGKGRSMM